MLPFTLTFTAEAVNEEPKIHVSPNEAYARVELHKPEELCIYDELQIQATVITTRNKAYASTHRI